MARFRVAAPARRDLRAILADSAERWGPDASARYKQLLEAAMRMVAAAPEGQLTRARSDLRPGVRSFHIRHARAGLGVRAPVHVLYFHVIGGGRVELLRVLHQRMSPALHAP